MSPYARQFVEQLEKPDVDLITGLPPSVAIEQRVTRGGGKSHRRHRHGGLSFPAAAFRKARHAMVPEMQGAGRRPQPCRHRRASGRAGAQRPRQSAGHARQSAQRFPHRGRAVGAEQQGFETLLVDGEFIASGGLSKTGALPRTHHRCRSLAKLREAEEARALVERALEIGKGTARLLDAKKPLHDPQHAR